MTREIESKPLSKTCQYEEGCPNKPVARVGLPGSNTMDVCEDHFDDWIAVNQKRYAQP